MLEDKRTVENRYRHYKGGIYYKLAEGIIEDNYSKVDENLKVECEATYEPTGEIMLVLSSKDNPLIFAFKYREIEDEEVNKMFLEEAILYQSEESNTNWVRLKEEFEGFNEQGVKRFTLANM